MELYFVTTIRRKPNKQIPYDNRCIGYYKSLKRARNLIKYNAEILSEAGWYQWAVIERFEEGTWYPYSYFQEWYRITKTKARKIKQPKRFEKICNFGIG